MRMNATTPDPMPAGRLTRPDAPVTTPATTPATTQPSATRTGTAAGVNGAQASNQWQGKTVARFKLLSILGKGGMGTVFRAQDIHLKRHVALKALTFRLSEQSVSRKQQLEQFVREARAAASIDHPNIVHVYEVAEANGVYYIAMELLEGGNLQEIIEASGPMEYPRACQLIAEAADALAHSHKMGIIHRDIKPSNLMLSRAGRCKVTDFGLARHDDPNDPFTLSSESVGTPLYLAPEIAFQHPASEQSDLYSLAGSLWFCLTGKPPFDVKGRKAAIMANAQSQLPNLAKLRPDLPKGLVEAIKKTLSKDPSQRVASAEQFGRILRGYCAAAPAPGLAATSLWSGISGQHKTIGVISVCVLAVAIFAGVLVYAFTRPGSSAAQIKPPTVHTSQSSGAAGVTQPPSAPAAPAAAAAPVPTVPAASNPVPLPAPIPAQAISQATAQSTSHTPAQAPAASNVIFTTELARLTALANQSTPPTITVEGVVSQAQTSSTGKVFRLFFEAGDDRKSFHVIYFPTLYAQMESKFGGKHGAALSKKRVRITGKPSVYQGRPQIRVDSPDQVVVVE